MEPKVIRLARERMLLTAKKNPTATKLTLPIRGSTTTVKTVRQEKQIKPRLKSSHRR